VAESVVRDGKPTIFLEASRRAQAERRFSVSDLDALNGEQSRSSGRAGSIIDPYGRKCSQLFERRARSGEAS
jgi:hypothetical protein